MKINWGVGITISIIVFTIISLWFAYFAFNQDVNLVRDDYYEAELKFNNKMEAIKRTNLLTEKLNINLRTNDIKIIFPKDFIGTSIIGNILLYRPSNREFDVSLPIQVDSMNHQSIETQNLIKGMWKIQVEWEANKENYFTEKIIMVQ